MKKQIAGLLTGFMICSALLSGCGKNEATQAAKESVETEKEGTGDTVEDEKKSDSKDTKGDSDEEKQEEEQVLDKVGVLLPEEGTDINSTLERTELKERLEEAGYDTQILEFIDMEHTPKNLLIRAVHTGKKRDGEALKHMMEALHVQPSLEKLL